MIYNAILPSVASAVQIFGVEWDGTASTMHDCYDKTKQMNSSNTNSGGWNSASYLNGVAFGFCF